LLGREKVFLLRVQITGSQSLKTSTPEIEYISPEGLKSSL